jgi:hypothetical protein
MMISEHLWVGKGPETHLGAKGVTQCATAKQAADAIRNGFIAVVPTTDVAHDTILALGYDPLLANHAVNRGVGPDDVESLLL